MEILEDHLSSQSEKHSPGGPAVIAEDRCFSPEVLIVSFSYSTNTS